MLPSLQSVRAAELIQRLLTGLEAEMVGVVQTQSTAGLLQLIVGEALERCLGGDGHEHRQIDGAMR